MAKPVMVPMTPGIVAADNYTISITALDPTTGAVVSAVKVSASAILATNIGDAQTVPAAPGPFVLIPGSPLA